MKYFDLTCPDDFDATIGKIIDRIEEFPEEDLQFFIYCGKEIHRKTKIWGWIFLKENKEEKEETDIHQKMRELCEAYKLEKKETFFEKSVTVKGDVTTKEVIVYMDITIPKDKLGSVFLKYHKTVSEERCKRLVELLHLRFPAS